MDSLSTSFNFKCLAISPEIVVMQRRIHGPAANNLEQSGIQAWEGGDWTRAIADLSAGVIAYRRVNAALNAAYCMYRLGLALLDSGDLDAAEARLEEADSLFSTLGELQLQASCQQLLARVERQRGHLEKGTLRIMRTLLDSRENQWNDVEGWCLLEQGRIEQDLNNSKRSSELFEEALQVAERLGSKTMQCRALDAQSRLTSIYPRSRCILCCRWALDCLRDVNWPYMVELTREWLLELERMAPINTGQYYISNVKYMNIATLPADSDKVVTGPVFESKSDNLDEKVELFLLLAPEGNSLLASGTLHHLTMRGSQSRTVATTRIRCATSAPTKNPLFLAEIPPSRGGLGRQSSQANICALSRSPSFLLVSRF
jgi:tetratricopeptide (TPR) repeat protein